MSGDPVRAALEVARKAWPAGTFWVSTNPPERRNGYIWAGLGIHHYGWQPVRMNTVWSLIHVGSGLRLCDMVGDVRSVFPVAGEIAECGDWTLFDMPGGWQQTDPDLMDKTSAIIAQNSAVCIKPQANKGTADDTRAMIAAREAAAVTNAAQEDSGDER